VFSRVNADDFKPNHRRGRLFIGGKHLLSDVNELTDDFDVVFSGALANLILLDRNRVLLSVMN
jgi:hypothetical protein